MSTRFKAAEEATQRSTDKKIKDKRINKQRVMLLSSRGITYRHRHLLTDLENFLPHSKKDAKLDTKSDLYLLNELAELNNCNNAIFFEIRKRQDLYLWMSKTPNGPSVKFHVQNLHTMDELKMTGNCLKGSRHVLSFDKNFDSEPHWQLLKELLGQVFNVPKGSRRSKPFVDHVLSFSIVDNRIWFRNYQILEKTPQNTPNFSLEDKKNDLSLVEIGPRFCLTVIRIFDGSFGGPTVFENPEFVHPNYIRAANRKSHNQKYAIRQANIKQRQTRLMEAEGEETELSNKNVFA
ncbi:Brix domain-containing protein [Halteromyces radiatus]|uniref:Brix domain-containing protein n=1 Tax=Halteromyces radiatus TaxID=101107 RepID=UPI00221F0991|nr:Brix domain-containing protein [Halteromyces radiatus]KAI8079847.1 Brix domain-containing protein [Halteromyces radiatus]